MLDGVGLGDFAMIYKALAVRYGWTARDIDQLELWEAAVYLGMDEAREVPDDPFDPRYGGHQLPERMARAAAAAERRRAIASGRDGAP